MKKALICAITGANGYVGSCIADYLRKRNFVVYEMGRSLKGDKDYFIPFSLEKEIPKNSLKNVDVLVHCAWDFKQIIWKDIIRINVNGSLRLFKAAKKDGVKKIIFISTMSAFDGCKSLYGKAKLKVEREAKKLDVIIIRPGLVYGSKSSGMVGAIGRLMAISPLVPVVAANQVLYLCHSKDLSKLIFRLCTSKSKITKPIIAASEGGLRFKEILRRLALRRGKKIMLVPIPSWAVLFGLKTLEKIGLKARVKSDSLIGLLNADPKPDFTETRKTKVRFREFLIE